MERSLPELQGYGETGCGGGGAERGLWLMVKGKVMTKWERGAERVQAEREQMYFWDPASERLLNAEVKPLPQGPGQ